MATVKCAWSGGKDSSCATHLHLVQGDKCIVTNYIPMFTEDIPLLLMGAEVYQVHGMTYWDWSHKVITKGKNEGRPKGFPHFITGACTFKNDSKVKALSQIDRKFNLQYDYMDLGIAFDEVKRHSQLNENKRSILVEQKITENMASEYCKKNGIYSPHYDKHKRDGCILCPQKKASERIEWFNQYPEAFELVLELQEFVKRERPEQYPLREKKVFIEEDMQISLFEEGTRYIIN